MTIHAVYRFDDESAIFVSDFRVTEKNNQADISYKFFSEDENLGLFLSGDVGLWKQILENFKKVAAEINVNNICEDDGVFKEYLLNYAFDPKYSIAKAIGFVISKNNEDKKNVIFQIEVIPLCGVSIQPINSNTFLSIGAGPSIPHLESRVVHKIKRDMKYFGMDYYQLAIGMRQEIISTIKLCGASSFSNFGISPFMSVSSLVGTHFVIRGEDIALSKYSNSSSPIFAKYSFTTNMLGDIVIVIYNSNREVIDEILLKDINSLTSVKSQKIFDPEQLEIAFDPAVEFSEHPFVYLLHQWVIPSNDFFESNTVYRSIKKIKLVDINFGNSVFKITCPLNPVIKEIKVSDEDIVLFPDSRDHYFLIDIALEKKFDEEISQDTLFNHQFLNNYIDDYSIHMYKGIID